MRKFDLCVLSGFITATIGVVIGLTKCNKKAFSTTEMISMSGGDDKAAVVIPVVAGAVDIMSIIGVAYCFNKLLKYLGGGVDA